MIDRRQIAGAGLLVLVILLLISFFRTRDDRDILVTAISDRYVVCSHCGAEYDVSSNHAANLDQTDVGYDDEFLLVRCDHCGEIAGRYGMVVELGGEVEIIGARRKSAMEEGIP